MTYLYVKIHRKSTIRKPDKGVKPLVLVKTTLINTGSKTHLCTKVKITLYLLRKLKNFLKVREGFIDVEFLYVPKQKQ